MQRRKTCPSVCQQQQQLSAKKAKAKAPLLNLYAYEKKMSTKNRKRQKYTKPVKPRKVSLREYARILQERTRRCMNG